MKDREVLSRRALAQVRNDFLRYQMLRGNMMVPGKTIEVAGQTFGPDGPKSAWCQPIEFTAHRNIVAFEWFFCGMTHEHDIHRGMLCSVHPAACSSLVRGSETFSSDVDPMASRPGARVPRLPWTFGFAPCSSCVLGDCDTRPPRSPKSVRSRSSAPSDSVSSASLSKALRKANSTRVSAGAFFRKWASVTVFAFSARARFSARLRCILSNPIHPILRAYKNSQ